jgi:hypothetical protein
MDLSAADGERFHRDQILQHAGWRVGRSAPARAVVDEEWKRADGPGRAVPDPASCGRPAAGCSPSGSRSRGARIVCKDANLAAVAFEGVEVRVGDAKNDLARDALVGGHVFGEHRTRRGQQLDRLGPRGRRVHQTRAGGIRVVARGSWLGQRSRGASPRRKAGLKACTTPGQLSHDEPRVPSHEWGPEPRVGPRATTSPEPRATSGAPSHDEPRVPSHEPRATRPV